VPHQLQRAVGDHLVGVHVGRRAGAALEHVELKLIVQRAVDDLAARALDAREDLDLEPSAFEVRARRGQLDHREGFDEVRIQVQRHAGDSKVLEPAGGLHAVVGVLRDRHRAQQIVLETGRFSGHHILLGTPDETSVKPERRIRRGRAITGAP
jgi:hypothetical protein